LFQNAIAKKKYQLAERKTAKKNSGGGQKGWENDFETGLKKKLTNEIRWVRQKGGKRLRSTTGKEGGRRDRGGTDVDALSSTRDSNRERAHPCLPLLKNENFPRSPYMPFRGPKAKGKRGAWDLPLGDGHLEGSSRNWTRFSGIQKKNECTHSHWNRQMEEMSEKEKKRDGDSFS